MNVKPAVLLLSLPVLFFASAFAGGVPEAEFAVPPTSKRPETYFFFFGGNISAEGITADLEAVKAAGISGVTLLIGNSVHAASRGVPRQVKCLSPEWDGLVGHFGRECRRLGLKFTMQVCPGWAMAGGPWIKPENAMRHLSASRTDVEGGRRVNVRLPQGAETSEPWRDWRDVAVVAFSAPEGDWSAPLRPDSVAGSVAGDWAAWKDGRGAVHIPAHSTVTVEFRFAKPVTVRTLEMPSVTGMAFVVRSFEPNVSVSLEADGATLVETLPLPPSSWQDERTFSVACRETTASRFVLTLQNSHPIALRTVRLYSAAKKDNWEAEAGWTLRSLLRRDTPVQSPSAWVSSASVTNVTAMMRPDGTFEWDAPAGRWAVLRIGHVNTGVKNIPAPPEGTGFECDKLSTAAADVQFDNYIGRLAASGAPAHGALDAMLMDSWECKQQTWTSGLDAVFAKRLGYDLFAWIPAVFGYVVGSPSDTARFLNDWRTLLGDLVSDNFFGHMARRARGRGLGIEFEAAFGNSIPGDIMRYYKYADTPMCEFWQPAVSFNFTPVKPAVSAAHVYGKTGVGAEAFTAFHVSWDEKLRDLKHNANMNLAEGISHFAFHTYTHNPQRPWLPPGTSFGGQGVGTTFVRGQTWWRHMPAFTDYFARCQTMLEAGRPVVDVLWHLGDECDGRPDHYAPFPEGFKYDLCNPDAFLSRMSVNDKGEWQTPGKIAYRVLWIPYCRRLLPETLEHIASGLDKGGVVAMAHLPQESATRKDGERGSARFEAARSALAGGKSRRGRLYIGRSIGDVLAAEKIGRDVYVEKGSGRLAWNHRAADGEDWYFIAPAEPGRGFDGTVAFRAGGGRGHVETWHPESGERRTAAADARSLRISLAPAQSCFVVFRKSATPGAKPLVDGRRAERRIVLDRPWHVGFPVGWGMPAHVVLGALKPWREIGPTPEARAFSGTATYETTFELDEPLRGMRAVLDLGKVESIAKVEVNGTVFPKLWAEPYSVDVTDAVKQGENVVRIEVTNTWFNRLVYDAGRPERERRTWTFRWPPANAPLRDSGLAGPVSLLLRHDNDTTGVPSCHVCTVCDTGAQNRN